MEITHGDIKTILGDKRIGTTVPDSFVTNMARAGYLPVIRQEGTGTRSTRYYKFSHLHYIFTLSQLTKLIDIKRLVQIPDSEPRKDLAISIGEYLAEHMARIQEVAMEVFAEGRQVKGSALSKDDLSPLMSALSLRLREKELEMEKKHPDMPACLFEGIRLQLNYDDHKEQFYSVELYSNQENKELAGTSKWIKTRPVNNYQDVEYRIYYTDPRGSSYQRRLGHEETLKGGKASSDTHWWITHSPVTEYPFVMAAAELFWVLSDAFADQRG